MFGRRELRLRFRDDLAADRAQFAQQLARVGGVTSILTGSSRHSSAAMPSVSAQRSHASASRNA
jgi:hypothetical protein